jgi:hypothetical protein
MSHKLFHITGHWPPDVGESESIVNVFLAYCKDEDEAKNLVADKMLGGLFMWKVTNEDVEWAGINIECEEIQGAPATESSQIFFVKSMVE